MLGCKNVLVLAPHADDAEFGVGGTLHRIACKAKAPGAPQVRVAIFAHGDYVNWRGETVSFAARIAETDYAMSRLGLGAAVFTSTFKENLGDLTPQLQIVCAVEDLLRDYQPEVVYTCLPSFNQDHRALYEATLTALRPGRRGASGRCSLTSIQGMPGTRRPCPSRKAMCGWGCTM